MTHSQNNEEKIILDYFYGSSGVFLDLGCNDGKTLSNTYALCLLGWKGIYVDASPLAFDKLKNNISQKDHIFYNVAIGEKNEKVTLFESGPHLGDNDIALVSTVNEAEKRRFEKTTKYTKTEVDCLAWESFIDQCPVKSFDFISMDIEGNEVHVLPFMDLSGTSMLCIEWNSNQVLKKEYEGFLKGFNLIHSNAENLIYAR